MSKILRGSCLCGAVTFAVDALEPVTAYCHCSMCRKFHGAAFATLAESRGFRWLTGADRVREYVAANRTVRSFCVDCGSSLGFRGKGVPLEHMEAALGCFDDPVQIEIGSHIYTDYKAPWCSITDHLPRHPEGSDSPPVAEVPGAAALVAEFYEVLWNRHRLEEMPRLLERDFVFRGSLGQEQRGHAGFADYVDMVHAALGDYTCTIEELLVDQGMVFAKMMFSGTHRGEFMGYAPTGRPVAWQGAALFRFRAGRICDAWVLGDLKSLEETLRGNATRSAR